MPTAAYIGTTARLLPLEWVQSVRMSQDSRYAIQTAASRSWAFVANGADRPADRTWEVTMLASVSTVSNLEALSAGAFGDGPFYWIPEDAYITNATTPAQSLLLGATGGPAEVVDGYAPRTTLGPSRSNLALGVPILPNEPVTVACDAAGSATLSAVFRNASGGVVETVTSKSVGTLMQRVAVSVRMAPSTARTVDVLVDGHVAAARPQVTYTPTLRPWGPGSGANSVIIERLDRVPRHIDGKRGLLYDTTLTLREVS